MQEVFEKIIYDKVLEKAWQPLGTFDEHSPLVIKVSDVKEIVRQTSTEYNNGWIPCSVQLPEERQAVYIRLDNGNVFRAEIRTRELLKEWWYCYGETDDMDMLGTIYEVEGWMKTNPVVAWQPLPEPYQPKGEPEHCCEK